MAGQYRNRYANEQTNAYWSNVVWSKGVDTILPVADRVTFFEGDGLPRRVAAWADVVRVMAPSMQELEGLPLRFRVSVFPNAEQMVGMGGTKVTG